MDQSDLRLRRGRTLSMMMENLSQVEIAQRLHVSQPTVSRDMQTLDKDTEKVSEFVRDVEFKFSIVWYTYLDIDRLVKEALENYAKLDQSDLRERMSILRVVTGLLGQKTYLLVYMGCDPSDDHRDNLQLQFGELKKMIDQLNEQIGKSNAPQTTEGPA